MQHRVEGVPRLTAALKRVAVGLRDLTRPNRAIASMVAPDVAAGTRVRSGALAGAWSGQGEARAARLANALPYAGVQEFGWPARGIPETRATTAAIAANRDGIMDAYTGEVRDLWRDAGGETDG